MRIGVLGPLQVVVAGRPVEVGGPRPRRVLAALVARAGEVISVDALVSAVWGQEPPPSAVRTLRVYVTRLRAALREDEPVRGRRGQVIVSVPSGYRLAIAPDVVDATVFVDRVRHARGALDQAEPDRAETLLAEAFGLWRGPPYGEFADTDFGTAEALRLEEVRLAGLEMRLDAALQAGRAAEVVAEAERLCAENPLRERFWAQLMVALYRCGRQADALAAFQRLRVLLAEEIGADPGPELRALEQRVLRQDPALDPPRPSVPNAVRQHEGGAGTPAARVTLPTERRVATVMVACLDPDPTGSGWSDPERADAALERFREVLEGILAEVDGAITGVTGAQAVAAFGVERAYDDHADRALHAALALRERYGSSVRVGVATGELLRRGGQMGLSVTGEPVRVGVGLLERAAHGRILVAPRTLAAARRRYTVTQATDHPAPGAPPLSWTELVDAVPQPPPGTSTTGIFVGRREELDALADAYRRTVGPRRPHLVTVVGDAGIGKSTLVARFLDLLGTGAPDAAVPRPVSYAGRCLAYGRGSSYDAFGEVLRAHLGIGADTLSQRVAERLAGREILGLTLGLDAAAGEEPREARERLHAAWVALMDDITAAAPVVLLIEDVHWAERPLLDLLHHLAGHAAGPLLVIATARPDYAEAHPEALGSRRHERVLWLDRLADAQVDEIVKRALGEPPTGAVRDVLATAEGNPFFLEELLATLRDQGHLVASPEGWRLAVPAGQAPLPDTVHGALAARIDCLGATARATLQAAAVVGREFSAKDVARLLQPVLPDLSELVERDLVRRRTPDRGEPQPAYSFKHALTRQVAYELLPSARRARLHARLADLLAEGDNLDERAPMLAHHYAEAVRADVADLAWADDPDTLVRLRGRAVAWLHRAGDLATRRFALEEALALLHRALDLEPDASTRAALWKAIGVVHSQRLDFPALYAAMTHALAASDDPQHQAAAYVALASAVLDGGIITSALPDDSIVEGWIERALALAAPGTPTHTHALAMQAVWAHETLAELAPQVWAAAESGDDQFVLGEAHGMQEILATSERRYHDTLDAALRLVAHLEAAGPDEICDAYKHPIGALMALGRFAEARDFAARNEAVAARRASADRAIAVAWWVEIETMAEEWARVCRLEDRVRVYAAEPDIGPTVHFVRAPLLCAVARAHLGDAEQAVELERLTGRLTGGAHDDRLAAPYIRLALARRDLDLVAALMARAPTRLRPWAQWWAPDLDVTRLDALAALDDAPAVEAEAPALLGDNRFLDAVARRALGMVRRDARLRRHAADAFTDMDLPAHAARCRAAPHRPARPRPASPG